MKLRTRYRLYQALICSLTFMSYAFYHAGRQPAGTAKAALNPNNATSVNITNQAFNQSISHYQFDLTVYINQSAAVDSYQLASMNSGWYPFNDPDHGGYWLSLIDTLYLAGYAVGMLGAGPLGDRVRLDYFLFIGMSGAGLLLICNGLFYYWNVHGVFWWAAVNFFGGIFQSSGWPANVTVMTRWFAGAKLGSILGIWSAQQPLGNIVGKQLGAGLQAAYGWPFNFIGLGCLLCFGGLLMLFFLINSPDQVFTPAELNKLRNGDDNEEKEPLFEEQYQTIPQRKISDDEYSHQSINNLPNQPITARSALIDNQSDSPIDQANELNQPVEHPHLSIWQCMMIPGVIEFGMSYFFVKFLSYALMFWLPYYLTKSLSYTPDTASTISTAFDYGGILGSIIAGVWSDWNKRRGWTSFLMCMACIPLLWIYEVFGHYGWFANASLLFLVGVAVNGPYSLISSAVCSDLGTHPVLNGNPHAMSTVTGIIDFFGSAGATFNGVVVASIAASLGWTAVFYSLMIVSVLMGLSIIRIVKHELFGQQGVVYGAQPDLQRAASDVSVMMESDDELDDEQQITIMHKDVSVRH